MSGTRQARQGIGLLVGLCVVTFCLDLSADDPAPGKQFRFAQVRMGIPIGLTLYAPDVETAEAAARAAFERIGEVDEIFSDYKTDSEVMRLVQKAQVGQPRTVSKELFGVLKTAREISCQSQGAFDVTVGPLVQLWRTARKEKKRPPPSRLAEARRSVGYQHLCLCESQRSVTFCRSGMRLDFGGIAKGYAGDEALRTLRQFGITSALIDAGGDIVLGAPPPGKAGWTIGLSRAGPEEESQSVLLRLSHCAVATSGDAFQFVEIDGRRYSHIVDPRTGLGLTNRSTVTVIGPSGALADGWASAVSVLGPVAGIKAIEAQKGLEAHVLIIKGDQASAVKTYVSSGFQRVVIPRANQGSK